MAIRHFTTLYSANKAFPMASFDTGTFLCISQRWNKMLNSINTVSHVITVNQKRPSFLLRFSQLFFSFLVVVVGLIHTPCIAYYFHVALAEARYYNISRIKTSSGVATSSLVFHASSNSVAILHHCDSGHCFSPQADHHSLPLCTVFNTTLPVAQVFFFSFCDEDRSVIHRFPFL